MRLKLRNVVNYVPTDEGILFRMQDAFLPVKGHGIGELFRRVQPFLDGDWTAEQLCAQLDGPRRTVLERLLNALRDAGMLYESGDDPSALPPSMEQLQAPFIRRIEAHNSSPYNSYALLRKTGVLLYGRAEILLQLAAAGIQAGLLQQTVAASDWTAAVKLEFARLARAGHSRQSCLQKIKLKNMGDLPAIENFDAVVLAAYSKTDWDWMERTSELISTMAGYSPAVLIAGPGQVVLGPERQPDSLSCLYCLRFRYEQKMNEAAPTLGHGPASSQDPMQISIGARLLVQRLLDCRSGASEKQCASLLEISPDLQISEHPLPIAADCLRCQRPRDRVAILETEAERSRPDVPPLPFSPGGETEEEQFLEQVYQHAVDPFTGLIQYIEEGDLVQLPHHQSAVWWRLPGDRGPSVLTTEAGENALKSRVEAVRKAFEQYLTHILQQPGLAADLFSFAPGSGHGTRPVQDLQAAVVVSGRDQEQLASDCFFQALGRYAFERSGWREIDMPASTGDPWADLTLAYLRDIGVGQKLGVKRHSGLSLNGIELLQFAYDANPVSVVAGQEGPELWQAGVKDLWLDVTRREAIHAGRVFPRVRFRSPQAPAGLCLEAKERLESILRLRLAMATLHRPELGFIKHFSFAYGGLSSGSEYRPRNAETLSRAVSSALNSGVDSDIV
jgi:hypothetical protein